jgi:hypothetical protein
MRTLMLPSAHPTGKPTSSGFNSPVTSEPTCVATFVIVFLMGTLDTKPGLASSVDFVNPLWIIPGRRTQKITKYNFSLVFILNPD